MADLTSKVIDLMGDVSLEAVKVCPSLLHSLRLSSSDTFSFLCCLANSICGSTSHDEGASRESA